MPVEFLSSHRPGFSPAVLGNPRHVAARKLERQVQVRFAAEACEITTPEGLVHARPGDAILTGLSGEHWRVSQAHFSDKYRPAATTRPGTPGAYVSLPYRVLALCMQECFNVLLADGVSRLRGLPGDWLVDYGDGSLGVVGAAIFAITYEVLD